MERRIPVKVFGAECTLRRRGPQPPFGRFKEWGFPGGEGNRNPSPPGRRFAYFAAVGKVGRRPQAAKLSPEIV